MLEYNTVASSVGYIRVQISITCLHQHSPATNLFKRSTLNNHYILPKTRQGFLNF